jgi:N-acetylglucosamine-6-sulfatase
MVSRTTHVGRRAVLAVALLTAALAPLLETDGATAVARPSIVVVMTDDQRWDAVSPTLTPKIHRHLFANGTVYPNAFVPDPLCCPSRSSTLTGNYSHTTGVYGNSGEFGGFGAFTSRGNEANTIATDLQAAGYRTALVGKYLNGYAGASRRYVPPGWDRWFVVGTGVYYDYAASNQGRTVRFGSDPRDYVTRVLRRVAQRFVERSVRKQRPFFLYLAPTAPHAPAIPDPRDVGRFSADPTTLPAYGQVDASKPRYMRDLSWSPTNDETVRSLARRQLGSMFGVDRAVGSIWRAAPLGTIFLFLSDNGLLWGEHAWIGKHVPYDPSLRVPFAIAVKGAPAPATNGRVVLNVDIRPTLQRLAGVSVTEPVEGIDVLGDPPRGPFVLEHADPRSVVPTYCGFRSRTQMYVRYSTGEEELYDEVADPGEVTNLAADGSGVDPSVLAAARARASSLCARSGGRIYPPDWPY